MANARVRVLQGTTLIATRDLPASASFQDAEFELTASEVSSVTNWDDLNVEIEWAAVDDTDFFVSHVSLLIPTLVGTGTFTKTVALDATLINSAIVSTQTGDWDLGSTWVGGVKPVAGTTVTINHIVTVDTTEACGHSPADTGTDALLIDWGAGGQLVIVSGGTLVVKGPVQCDAAFQSAPYDNVIDVQSGGTLELDASSATDPTNQQYAVTLGSTGGSRLAIKMDGIFRSNSGGGNAYLTRNGLNGTGGLISTSGSFLRIGDATNNLMELHSEPPLDIDGATFDACGELDAFGGGTRDTTAVGTCKNCEFKNTAAAIPFRVGGSASPSGTRDFQNNKYDKQPSFVGVYEFELGGGSVYGDGLSITSEAFASFDGAFIHIQGAVGPVIDDDAANIYLYADSVNNPHFVQLGGSRDITLDGFIFEHGGTQTNGDCILAGTPGSARVNTVKNCIKLPNSNGGSTGALVSCLGNANVTMNVLHNTAHVGSASAVCGFGETYSGHTGMGVVKSNIMWDTSARGYKVFDGGTAVTDVVQAADGDFNCGDNLLAGSELKGYDTPVTGSPGANDVDVDPQFVDSTRDLAGFDADQGGPGTAANAFTNLLDGTYAVATLLTYVRTGFEVQASSLNNAGHDSVTIGSQQFVGTLFTGVRPRQRPKWHFRVEPVRQIEIVRKARSVVLPTPSITTSATVSLDAVLGTSLQKTVALTGVLQELGVTKTVALTGVLQELGVTKTVALTGFLSSSVQKTVALTGILQTLGVTKTVSLDALLGTVSIRTVAVTAVLLDTVTTTVALTGVLQEQGLTVTVALTGVVQQQGITDTVALNALLSQTTTLTVALAGSLSGSSTIQVPCTAVLTGAGTLTFTTFWARTRKR